ncbi:hypothetical protein [Mycobacteroides abscessus]|uniref:hypothetical protein n=1 Tax=Mycobacteroides abscessus TaxID=36809 RepID=UPI0005E175F7|nr:hypothetical protein [Mycobacteroides abscessus]CPR69821.1 transmembrane protein [Mycobacteroides abscessus]CPU70517.1 transmembrane protein [Mycobacteroides abscessus]
MPATSGGAATPTRSQIEAWQTTHLEAAATHWTETAGAWEGHFTTIHDGMLRPGGTKWEGAGADSAADSSWGDLVKVRGAADALHSAASAARNGADDIDWAKRQATAAITEAEQAGFTVGEDLSVREQAANSLMRVSEARQQQMQEFADEIASRAQTLAATDKAVAGQITDALAPLEGLSFPEDGKPSHEPTVQLVDNHFKLNPQDGGEDPDNGEYKPHPQYPDHKPNGEWGPGNSGLEGHAEAQKAFDARTRDTGIRIERKLIWVYLTDPETGKTLRREYDGLEEIPGQPGKYTGLEHKLGKKDPTPHQTHFDDLVRSGIPARGMLNGQPIEVVDAELIRTPRPDNTPAPGAGASAGEGAAGPAPVDAGGWGGVEAQGTVPVTGPAGPVPGTAPVTSAPGSAPVSPTWGTHLTPQQMIDSGDPALRVAGEEIRRQMQANGQVDPSGTA